MRVGIKLLGQAREYSAYPESSGKFQPLDISENSTVKDVLDKLAISKDIPLLVILNQREADLGEMLKEDDELIICPPIYGG